MTPITAAELSSLSIYDLGLIYRDALNAYVSAEVGSESREAAFLALNQIAAVLAA